MAVYRPNKKPGGALARPGGVSDDVLALLPQSTECFYPLA